MGSPGKGTSGRGVVSTESREPRVISEVSSLCSLYSIEIANFILLFIPVCDAGYFDNAGNCTMCDKNFVKENPGNEGCSPCQSNYVTENPGATLFSQCGACICKLSIGFQLVFVHLFQ